MGRTSTTSRFNLPGRYAWCIAELVSPLNLIYILLTLPHRLHPAPNSPTSVLGTGLPFWNELLALLFVAHYANRAVISPLYLAPSMSPIHAAVALCMCIFNFCNSSSIAAWLCYSISPSPPPSSSISTPTILFGLFLFLTGLTLNIASENHLFSLRRAAARRKARSEGRAFITYDKVYVIPPAESYFKHILYPHYVSEWAEWMGYAIMGYGAGLGFAGRPPIWFWVNEFFTMLPRARSGRAWYEARFGKRALVGRGAVIPGGWF
ncbi:MAG: hypothetical protein Q9227_005894 [Pyrenula ochraceoflavens]